MDKVRFRGVGVFKNGFRDVQLAQISDSTILRVGREINQDDLLAPRLIGSQFMCILFKRVRYTSVRDIIGALHDGFILKPLQR